MTNMGYGVPIEAIADGPEVQWNHIDGPLLHWAGRMHWLTWRERLAIWLGFRTVMEVARLRWPYVASLYDLYKEPPQ